ncbi:type II toxin-antitoxin system PemK/MazF family toxin [bacterium]|nr:type II toxin-antitoxin system PemK/MazF family toxin [bacterium]
MEQRQARSHFPRRGAFHLVNLDPTLGMEIKKTRPAVIIQNDFGNQHGPLTIVAPLTSTTSQSPVRVLVKASEGGLKNDSCILLNQIRAVNKRRLVRYMSQSFIERMRSRAS